jgi:hypothetical protein
VLFGINGIDNLTAEKPILLVKLTGKSEDLEMEWKMPNHFMQKSTLPTYEVVLQSFDKNALIFRTFLPGELCAVRAKIFRFHPLINFLGISNKYQLDLVYSGYFTAEKYAKFPVEARPISFPRSFFHSCLFNYWNSFFAMKTSSYWIKSATLESNYFPLVDKKGKAFQGEFLLTISDSGLSAIAHKGDDEKCE